MTDVLAEVRAHLHEHFVRAGITAEPDAASVTFLGTERIDVLRFGPDGGGVYHYVSLGCSRHPMFDPTEMVSDALRGPRAEVVVALRGPSPRGLSRSVAILAAAPAVEGLMLEPDALVDLRSPLWDSAPFTAFLFRRGNSRIRGPRGRGLRARTEPGQPASGRRANPGTVPGVLAAWRLPTQRGAVRAGRDSSYAARSRT